MNLQKMMEDSEKIIAVDEALTRLIKCAPMPWVLDHRNCAGVMVKDGSGRVIYYEDFGGIPDEMPSVDADEIRMTANSMANYLIALSDLHSANTEISRHCGKTYEL